MFSGAWLVDSNMVYPPFVKLIWVYISVGVNFLLEILDIFNSLNLSIFHLIWYSAGCGRKSASSEEKIR